MHTGIAGITQTPELAIDKAEGELLANASVNVMRQFDLTPDPKTQAMIGLIVAAGTVYGPRAYLIRERKAQEARAKAAGTDGLGTATVINGAGAPAGVTDFQVN